MTRVLLPSIAVLATSVAVLAKAADIESGPSVGQKAGAFNVKDITGPYKGKSLCYR